MHVSEHLGGLYHSSELRGECLCSPLKRFRGFVIEQLHEARCNTSIGNLMLAVAAVVSSLFVYPILIPLAGLGVFIKLAHLPEVILVKGRYKFKMDEFNVVVGKYPNSKNIFSVVAKRSLLKDEKTC
ncbi:MAG: hypothetical protein P4L16_06985 [Chlamydiales bacterium]|nr:hypothetical protein [Chlamydiales bacterium]